MTSVAACGAITIRGCGKAARYYWKLRKKKPRTMPGLL
jgi:hypothetical protein